MAGRRVPEIGRDDIREVFQRTYRINYRVGGDRLQARYKALAVSLALLHACCEGLAGRFIRRRQARRRLLEHPLLAVPLGAMPDFCLGPGDDHGVVLLRLEQRFVGRLP